MRSATRFIVLILAPFLSAADLLVVPVPAVALCTVHVRHPAPFAAAIPVLFVGLLAALSVDAVGPLTMCVDVHVAQFVAVHAAL